MNGEVVLAQLPSGPLCALLLEGLLDVRDLGRLAAAVGAAAFRARVLSELAAANAAFVAKRVLLAAELGALARWGLRVRLLKTHAVKKDWWRNTTEEWRCNGQPHRDGDRPAVIWYHYDGRSETWYQAGRVHRGDDRPATVDYRADGRVEREEWYQNGQRHRDGDGPAWIQYRDDGTVAYERWYQAGRLHRDGDRPAWIQYHADGSVDVVGWYHQGKYLHHAERPARR